MKKRNGIYFFTMTIAILSLLFLIKMVWQPSKETITFFPINENAVFSKAKTGIDLKEVYYDQNRYKLLFQTDSRLDRKAFLRQDIGFLFKNGRLIDTLGLKWKQNKDELIQKDTINQSEGGLYQGVTFHYAEIHEGNKISSVQKMSKDQLYVIQSKFKPTIESFRTPNTKEEREWEKTFQQLTEQQLQALWKQGIREHGIRVENYTSIPLTALPKYNLKPLPGFTVTQSKNIMGRLWEGIYKNYFLGIKKEDGTEQTPIDSYVPLILLNHNKNELLVLIITKDKDSVLLIQKI